MTTVEALQQSIANTRVRDLSNVSVDDAQCLITALNFALQEFFDLAPDRYKRTTLTSTLEAPASMSVVIANGATVTTGNPFTAAQRGSTITLSGDSMQNEIVATNALLRPYLGSAGTASGTVYGDAVQFTNFRVERVIGHPRVWSLEDDYQTTLRQVDGEGVNDGPQNTFLTWWHTQHTNTGTPNWYKLEYVGGSEQTASDSVMLLRVAPKPTQQMGIEMEVDIRSAAYAITAVTSPQNIPVDRSYASHLLPLIKEHLISTPLWTALPQATRKVEQQAATARQRIEELPTSLVRPINRIRTPNGW